MDSIKETIYQLYSDYENLNGYKHYFDDNPWLTHNWSSEKELSYLIQDLEHFDHTDIRYDEHLTQDMLDLIEKAKQQLSELGS